jgi:hypothetical protein
MRKDTPYNVTEWEWLKLQLQVRALLKQGSEHGESFEFDQGAPICCRVYCSSIERMLNSKVSRKQQLICYRSWARGVKQDVEEVLANLPVLKREFDPDGDVIVEIMCDYGTGAYRVCALKGKHVEWLKPATKRRAERDPSTCLRSVTSTLTGGKTGEIVG